MDEQPLDSRKGGIEDSIQEVGDIKSDVYGEVDDDPLSSSQPMIQDSNLGYPDGSGAPFPMQNVIKPHEHISSSQPYVPVTCFALGLIFFLVCDIVMQPILLLSYFLGMGWVALVPFIPFVIGSFYVLYPSSTAKVFAWMNIYMALLAGGVLILQAVVVVLHGIFLVALTVGSLVFTCVFGVCFPLVIVIIVIVVFVIALTSVKDHSSNHDYH